MESDDDFGSVQSTDDDMLDNASGYSDGGKFVQNLFLPLY
jgi:hypothetical protein